MNRTEILHYLRTNSKVDDKRLLAFKNLIFNNNLVIIYLAIKNTMNGFRPYAFVNIVAAIINKVKKLSNASLPAKFNKIWSASVKILTL